MKDEEVRELKAALRSTGWWLLLYLGVFIALVVWWVIDTRRTSDNAVPSLQVSEAGKVNHP